MACPSVYRCLSKVKAATTKQHPDECECSRCLVVRKPLIDQIIELNNDIKRKEHETGEVPNMIRVVTDQGKALRSDDLVSV